MGGLDPEILFLRRIVNKRCFIRRDKFSRALFISDFPRRLTLKEVSETTEHLEAGGVRISLQGGLALLDWTLTRYERFLQTLEAQTEKNTEALPETVLGLCRILKKHPAPLEEAMLPELKDALLLWDSGNLPALLTIAGNSLAIALRTGKASPCWFVPLLLCMHSGETKC